jgi:hypothetical protein
MSDNETILTRLRQALPSLERRYPIRFLGLFGSVARGDAGPSSDVDVLVEFSAPVSLTTFLSLETELAAIAGRKVDLISRQALKPFMQQHVMRDLVAV